MFQPFHHFLVISPLLRLSRGPSLSHYININSGVIGRGLLVNYKNHSYHLRNSKGLRSSAKNPGQRPNVFIKPHTPSCMCTAALPQGPKECSQMLTHRLTHTHIPPCMCVRAHPHSHPHVRRLPGCSPSISTWALRSLLLGAASARAAHRGLSPEHEAVNVGGKKWPQPC